MQFAGWGVLHDNLQLDEDTGLCELPWIAAQVHLNCPYYCNPDNDVQALQLSSYMMSKLPSNIEQSGCHPTSWPCLHLYVCHASEL